MVSAQQLMAGIKDAVVNLDIRELLKFAYGMQAGSARVLFLKIYRVDTLTFCSQCLAMHMKF